MTVKMKLGHEIVHYGKNANSLGRRGWEFIAGSVNQLELNPIVILCWKTKQKCNNPLDELGLPGFELSDLEQGSVVPVLQCLENLKAHFVYNAQAWRATCLGSRGN
ncbi:hypothetical protein KIW84_064673 [Lathyrus oleraceus]|uniref:Uncharacterized protein n=1 Tax=Pisum sativum TaxID=3888 RepID=A0A9D4WEZ5_PEA|nr:hypothetical protein KIW84_064673 [Pisum sativum]